MPLILVNVINSFKVTRLTASVLSPEAFLRLDPVPPPWLRDANVVSCLKGISREPVVVAG